MFYSNSALLSYCDSERRAKNQKKTKNFRSNGDSRDTMESVLREEEESTVGMICGKCVSFRRERKRVEVVDDSETNQINSVTHRQHVAQYTLRAHWCIRK